MKISSILGAAVSLIRLLLSLLVLWLSLGWRVRKTRKAFEKQLILQGMSKKDAERLSHKFAELKDEMMSVVKRSFFRG